MDAEHGFMKDRMGGRTLGWGVMGGIWWFLETACRHAKIEVDTSRNVRANNGRVSRQKRLYRRGSS